MELEINTKGKGLFLFLSSLSLVLMMMLTTLLWWFISPRLHEISNVLAFITLYSLRIFFAIIISGILLVILTCYTERNFLITKFAVRLSIIFLFPVAVILGKMFGIKKDKIRDSFVYVNNSFVKALKKKFKAKEVLILLPHCLQHVDCKIRITTNIQNCVNCGRCDIGDLKNLANKYKTHIAIATGGTLARRIIVNIRPKFIIAVACQRDLVDGIQDVFPIPVYGVLNDRPEGPCINTRVVVQKLELALQKVLVDLPNNI